MAVFGEMGRRGFIKATAAAATVSLGGWARAAENDKVVRVGFVGVGGRGTSLLGNVLQLKHIAVPAVCDINPAAAERAAKLVAAAGFSTLPSLYTEGELAWQKMLTRDDLDLVVIATPWRWHTPIALQAMRHGIIPGIEVPCSLSIEECWSLVDTSEKTGIGCMMLENWSFRSDNLAVLNMARQGLFGKIVHAHCAHSHDCIDHWFFDKQGHDLWPAEYLLKYNRDQYPTHSVGPVLSWCDIHCGDRFTTIASTPTSSSGINDYFARTFGKDHPGAKRTYAQGDIVTSTLTTANGKTVIVNYDMQLPRPYDNRWMLQGTLGVYDEPHDAVYLAGKSPKYHTWEPFAPYHERYKHRWWRNFKGFGDHDGVDGLMLSLLVEAIRDGRPLPLDVYDSVAMSAIVPLSGDSIAAKNVPVEFPDFTRGKWKTTPPKFAVEK